MDSITAGPSRLRDLVRRYLGDHPAEDKRNLKDVLAPLERTGWPVYLFGGVPRDLMRMGGRARPRDIDLVIDGVSVDDIADVFADASITRNRFGGLRVHAQGWAIDAWPVQETWAFSQDRLGMSASAAELPRTTFLNVEAVAVELWPRSVWHRRVYDCGFFSAFHEQTVELNFADNPFPEFAVLRSLLVACKLQFCVGPRLADYIRDRIAVESYRSLLEINRQHYPSKLLAPAILHDWIEAIQSAPPDTPVQLPHVSYGAPAKQTDLFEGHQRALWPRLSTSSFQGAHGWAY